MTSIQSIQFTLSDGSFLVLDMLCGWHKIGGGVITPPGMDLSNPEIKDCIEYCQRAYPYIETLYAYGDYKSALSDDEVDFIHEGIELGYLTREEFEKHQDRAEEYLNPKPQTSPKQKLSLSGYVYLVESSHGVYKIGHTNDPTNRIKTFNVKLPFPVDYVCLIKTEDRFDLERRLHDRFKDKRIDGEWFQLSSADVDYLKGLSNDK